MYKRQVWRLLLHPVIYRTVCHQLYLGIDAERRENTYGTFKCRFSLILDVYKRQTQAVTDGMGNTLKGIALIVGLGSMFGGILEVSGAAQAIADKLVKVFGCLLYTSLSTRKYGERY